MCKNVLVMKSMERMIVEMHLGGLARGKHNCYCKRDLFAVIIRMGDFDWSVDLIKNLIAKGIWFGAHEPPSVQKVPRRLSKKNVPEYAFAHRNDKFKYLFHAQQSPETSKEKEIVMPYCSCKGEKKNPLTKL